MSCSCIGFVYERNITNLSCSDICSALLMDTSCQQIVSYMPRSCAHNSLGRAANWSSFSVQNGHTPVDKYVAEIVHVRTAVRDDADCWNVQFAATGKVYFLKMDSILAGYVTKALNLSSNFRRSFVNYARHCGQRQAVLSAWNVFYGTDAAVLEPCCSVSVVKGTSLHISSEWSVENTRTVYQSIIVVMTQSRRPWIDYLWCWRVCGLVVKRMELDDAMNWLSTLGGAYSSLGDYFIHHAHCAAKISLKQLRVALEMGSPPVVIRCHIYFALSLLQTGRLRAAKHLVAVQYQEVRRLPVHDTQLVAMCRSLWNRLRYLRRKRINIAARSTFAEQLD